MLHVSHVKNNKPIQSNEKSVLEEVNSVDKCANVCMPEIYWTDREREKEGERE